MTGPEHYAEAERLLSLVDHQWGDAVASDPYPRAAVTVARAQVHATLALAAASVDAAYWAHSETQPKAWAEVSR